jgi:hypothetical protein
MQRIAKCLVECDVLMGTRLLLRHQHHYTTLLLVVALPVEDHWQIFVTFLSFHSTLYVAVI